MNENWSEIKQNLLRQGKIKSMCNDNLSALRKCDAREDAIALYKKTIDWGLENNYPPLSFLRDNFANRQSEDCGVYVSRKLDVTVSSLQSYVFHDCKGVVNAEMDYDSCTIPMLYFANGCDVTVTCRQPNARAIRIPIYATDDCRIKVKKTSNAMFTIYKIQVKEERK